MCWIFLLRSARTDNLPERAECIDGKNHSQSRTYLTPVERRCDWTPMPRLPYLCIHMMLGPCQRGLYPGAAQSQE